MKAADWFDVPTPCGYFVYALWSADRSMPLYVGQSTNLLARIATHLRDPDKRNRIARVSAYRCASKAEMDETEQRLITAYCPPWNRVGLPAHIHAERRTAAKAAADAEVAAVKAAAAAITKAAADARGVDAAQLLAGIRAIGHWLKPSDVADQLGCTVADVKRYFAEGSLQYGRFKHVHPNWVVQMLEGVPAEDQVISA